MKLEKVRALRPSHVIVNVDENTRQTADALGAFVPQLIVTHPLGPLDNLALYRQIGTAFGKEHEAEMLCSLFERAFRKIGKYEFPQRRVLYLIWKDPWMTVSRDTYVSRMLAAFNLQTLPYPVDERYPKLAGLDVSGVEIILLSTEPYRFREPHVREIRLQTRKPAFLIDGEMTSWYGSRAIQALGYLAEFTSRLPSTPAAA